MKLTLREQDKKIWYYFQRFIQYGYLFSVSTLVIYRISVPVCCSNPYSNSYYYFHYDIETLIIFISLGLLMIYWHKNTTKL